MSGIPILIASFTAFLIGLCAVPIVRRIALACGFLDDPDRCRKLHGAPIALGGGIAVWLAAWAGCGVGLLSFAWGPRGAGHEGWFLAALALATSLILGLGIIDDRSALRGRQKLAGQVAAAAILVGLGLRIDSLSCLGVRLELGVLAYPVSVIWILLVVNAFNLIDGMDGFCGSLGLVASLAITLLACRAGRLEDAMAAMALAGALAAFLIFNLPPARIYLGDAGSMMIGMMISALSVRSCTDGPRNEVLTMPLAALLLLPVLDTLAAIGRRWLKGRSIFAPDRGHIHHCLRSRLGSTAAALGVAVLLATAGACGATLAVTSGLGDWMACLAIVLSTGLLLCTNTFGATEIRLLVFRIKVALIPLWIALGVRPPGIGQECHLVGSRDWAKVWDVLIDEGRAIGVYRIELVIDLIAEGEAYQGHWSAPTVTADEPHWWIVHTLHAGGAVAGVIRVAGAVDAWGSSCLDKVERLVQIVEDGLVSDDEPLSSAASASLSHVNLSVNSVSS